MDKKAEDYQATGTIHRIEDLNVISEKFKVQEFSIQIPGAYPQVVAFQCANQKIELLDGLNPGTKVRVHFNLRGRESAGRNGKPRVWNSLDCWRIERSAAISQTAYDDDVPF